MTNYGKIDILWYDVDVAADSRAVGIGADERDGLRAAARHHCEQPQWLPKGFRHAGAAHPGCAEAGRAWETCMTLNDSWGFNRGDDAWKTPKTIVDNLITCARGGGNYLLNIGPKPDGSIPPESVEILETVGKWLDTNGKAIYGGAHERRVGDEPELHAARQHALCACVLLAGPHSGGGVAGFL
jgi:alpha-L-fucosidase